MPTLKEMVHASGAKKEPKEKEDPMKRLNPMGETWDVEYVNHGDCMMCDRTEFISTYNGTCVVCDSIMTPKEYDQMISKKTKKKVKKVKKEEEDQNMFNDDDIEEEEVEVIEKPEINRSKKGEKPKMDEKYEIQEFEQNQSNDIVTLEEKKQAIVQSIELFEFVVSKILRESDYHTYKNGKQHIKRSGCQKLATAFNVSTETLSIEIEKEYNNNEELIDIHATAYVKATRPNGSFVIIHGSKSKSEYWSEKYKNFGSYNLHNLKATAETKASNRATLNAVGFGMVSADEIGYNDNFDDDSEDSGDLF